MILGKVSDELIDSFSVTDSNDKLVPGIDTTSFTFNVFNPEDNEVSSSVNLSVVELGFGHYRIKFTPDMIGTWMFAAYHPVYFPWGKTNNVKVYTQDFDSITVFIKRILGLVQENFEIDQTEYDTNGNLTSSRIRIYDDEYSVGTDSNIMAVYQIEATYDDQCMKSYKVIKS